MRLKIAGTIAFLILIIKIQFVYASNYDECKIDNIIAEFEGQLVSILKKDRTDASISFALINKSNIVYVNAIGHAKSVKPADSMSIYRIGSITKTFTAFLMMQLVEDGTIHLDEAVEIYLPEIKYIRGYDINRKITFRQLASHTSGMIREPRNLKSLTGGIELWENKTLISISKTSLKNQSGEKFLYSNIGYALLGLALSRAANKPFMELIEEKIFIPLGMTNTYFKIPKNKSNQLALGMSALFKNKINKRAAKEHNGRGYKVPSGGIYSTSIDLAKFIIALSGGGNLLSPTGINEMQSMQDPNNIYGLGLQLFSDDSISVVCHEGVVDGYNSLFALENESNFGVVILRNYNSRKTNLFKVAFDALKKLKYNQNEL